MIMDTYPDLRDDESTGETVAREEPGLSIHPSRDLERRVDRLEEHVRELTKHIAFLFAEYHKEQP